jgi:type IV pilus biogenesis protein CpaD/CtpE
MKLLFFLVAVAGCASRAHLTESHARATREIFARQVANPSAQPRTPKGLDAQEAAAVVAAYRTQLGGKGAAAPADPILVAPAQGR